jgi:zinc-ribbon domain
VYEGPKGTLGNQLWQSSAERLIDVSEKTYKIQLTSPAQEGQWIITGYAFYHITSGSGYFSDQERGPGFVEMRIMVADNAKLTLRTPHGNMPVSVDGTALTTDKDGLLVHEVKVLADHSIAAPGNVSMAEGWRATFRSWNGTDHQNPKILKVTKDVLLTVDYLDEFRLDVISDPGYGVGAGWYRAGVVANFSVPMFVPQEGLGGIVGIRLHFTGWSGDILSKTNSESVVMDHPYRVVANWTIDYQQSYYMIIGAIVLVAAALAAFIARRAIAKKPPAEEEGAPPVREFCMHCGAALDPDAKFCLKCGESQVSSE